MRVTRSTDGQHLGTVIPVVNRGESVELDGFTFEVQQIATLENGNTLLSNFNYQLECEE
jgi:hypothetical protein